MLQRDGSQRPLAAELLSKNVFALADDTVQRRRVEVAAFFANPRNDLPLMREIQQLLAAFKNARRKDAEVRGRAAAITRPH